MTANNILRRKRADAASNARSAAAKARKREMNPSWWAALYDRARGRASVVRSPATTLNALIRRGLITETWAVTAAGYDRLMARRGDPVYDRTEAEVVAYYLTLRDAPAWPMEGT